MDNQQKVLWRKLSLSLESLTVTSPSTVLPVILELQGFILNEDTTPYLQKINFMTYELMSRCQNLTELDRKDLLSDYFFNEKSFLVNHLSKKSIDINDWFLSSTIDQSQGVSFLISLLYMHFAQTLEIPIYLIDTSEDNILKWVVGNKPVYLDITLNSNEITDQRMCEILVKMHNNDEKIPNDCFDILPTKEIIKKYLHYISNIYRINNNLNYLKTTLDILLKIEPANLKFIHESAIVCKKLNLNKEAIEAIRKYFSLNGENNAPKDLKVAYYELKNLTTPKSTLLH